MRLRDAGRGGVAHGRDGLGPLRVVRNLDTGATVAASLREARSFWQRFVGLMGRKALPASGALLIWKCPSVHTFFMRFPIDIAYLDRDLRVVGLRRSVPPWKIVPGAKGAAHTLELAAGALETSGTEVGHRVSIASLP